MKTSEQGEKVSQIMKRKFRLRPTVPGHIAICDLGTVLMFMNILPDNEHIIQELDTKKLSTLFVSVVGKDPRLSKKYGQIMLVLPQRNIYFTFQQS